MRIPIQADLYLPQDDGYRRHRQVPFSSLDGAVSDNPERGPYLFEDQTLIATRPDGSERFTVNLPEKARQVVELGSDRLVVQAGQQLLSLDAETGHPTGQWTSPYFLPDLYRSPDPGQVAVRQQSGMAVLDRDLNPVADLKFKGFYNYARPLRKGGWLVGSGDQLKVLSGKGRMRVFSREAIGSSAQEGPDGRVWFLETREGKRCLVRCDPTSAARAERIPLASWGQALFPLADGRFVTAGRSGRIHLHAPDGKELSSLNLDQLDSVTVSGDQLLAVTSRHRVMCARLSEPLQAEELGQHQEPVFACLGQDGQPVLFSESRPPEGEAPLAGQSWRERWGQASWSTPEQVLELTRRWGLLPAGEAAGIPGRTDATWISPPLEGQPSSAELQPVQVAPSEDWLFSESTAGIMQLDFAPESQVPLELPLPGGQGTATLRPNHAVLNLLGKKWEGPYLPGKLETAVPLTVQGEAALLTASRGTVHLVGPGDNHFFPLGTPVQNVSIFPDRVVVHGTDGRLLVLHTDATRGPDELSASLPDIDSGAGGLSEGNQAIRVGGAVLRKNLREEPPANP